MVSGLYKISQYRMVKVLYTIYLATFMFAIEINIFSAIDKDVIGIKNILILILIGIVIQYLESKEKKSTVTLSVVISINLLYSIIFHWVLSYENHSVIIFFINLIYILIYNNFDENNIEVYNYKRMIKPLSIILLIVSAFFLRFLSDYENSYMYKVYLIYIMSYILLLSESRRFSLKLHKKEENIAIMIYLFITIFMFTSSFNKIIKIIIYGFGRIVEYVAYIIAIVLYYTIGKGLIKLKEIILRKKSSAPTESINNISRIIEETTKNTNDKDIKSQWFFILVYCVIIILGILIIIYVIRKFRMKSVEKYNFIQIREKIENIKIQKKKNKKYNDSFWDENNKTIFVYYRKFLQICFKKKLYKKHMTARQLRTMVNTKIPEKSNQLKELTEIYNEAKFSKHILNNDYTKNVENAYKNIEKPLKNI